MGVIGYVKHISSSLLLSLTYIPPPAFHRYRQSVHMRLMSFRIGLRRLDILLERKALFQYTSRRFTGFNPRFSGRTLTDSGRQPFKRDIQGSILPSSYPWPQTTVIPPTTPHHPPSLPCVHEHTEAPPKYTPTTPSVMARAL